MQRKGKKRKDLGGGGRIGNQSDQEVEEVSGNNGGSDVVFEKSPPFGLGGHHPRPFS